LKTCPQDTEGPGKAKASIFFEKTVFAKNRAAKITPADTGSAFQRAKTPLPRSGSFFFFLLTIFPIFC
jgi:hypothetical protein